MTDTPSNSPAPQSFTLGFLTILHDANGVLGGYLLTNAWGRPLEFRLSTAVQPNRVQQILYGPTLTEYLHADLIGKTLIEKTSQPPSLVIADTLPALALRSKLDIPVVAIRPEGIDLHSADVLSLQHPASSAPLVYSAKYADEVERLEGLLNRIDSAVDLAEPFARIREAVAEARKMGVTNRAAA